MKNYVVAGDYKGGAINAGGGTIMLCAGFLKPTIYLDKSTVASYELYGSQQHQENGYSAVAGAIGSAAFGDAGFLAGNYTKTVGTYQLVINFRDGKRSLVEVNERIYKTFLQVFF